MGIPTWPRCLLPPTTVRLSLQSQARGGGQALSGQEQVTVSPAARWGLTLTDIPIRTRAQILTWRALEAQLDGRANPIYVPIFDGPREPAITLASARVPFSDQTTFSDGSLFSQSAVFAKLAGRALANATQVQVSWTGKVSPDAGQHFSLGDRIYRIARIDPTDTQSALLTIRPWLRDTWASGTPLVFDDPVGLFRLAKDDAMSLDLELWKYGHPSVELVEYF